MKLLLSGEIAAQILGCLGLADAGNIVALAFDGHQRGLGDLRGIDRFAAMAEGAARQIVIDEYLLHRLQIEFRRQVHHRHVFIVEFAVLLGGIAVTLDQMPEQFAVRVDMAVEIHGHESAKLQEARINAAHHARVRRRHFHDYVVAEPVRALFLCQFIDRGGIAPRVDGAAHQDHRLWRARVVVGIHQRHRGQHRNRRLAHRHDARAGAEMAQELRDIIDIVVEIECAADRRNHAGVDPVGDVNIVMRQHRLHGSAQQRGIVARHRRDDQHLVLGSTPVVVQLAKVQKTAEILVERNHLFDGHQIVVNNCVGDAEGRLSVAPGAALEHFERRRERPAELRSGQGIGGAFPEIQSGIGHRAPRRKCCMVHFVKVIKHGSLPPELTADATNSP